MKKLFLSLVAALMSATVMFAQSSLLATLSHDGSISTFYGADALKDAYNAAKNGDVITLSSGSFNAVDIAKGLTIRGAGMGIDTLYNSEPTVIMGNFSIKIPNTVTSRFTLEGIYHNHEITVNTPFKNGTFIKDRFRIIRNYGEGSLTNLTMIHCKVAEKVDLYNNSSVSCVNCIINNPGADYNSSLEFLNCIVECNDLGPGYVGEPSFKNCILVTTSQEENWLSRSSVAYNCVGISTKSDNNIFKETPNTTNVMKKYSEVFKTFRGTYSDEETFELTETAKRRYKGIDGTQVGIYGGNMPFSMTPTNPQITKCNVAAKSTADGKLSVDIEVNGVE